MLISYNNALEIIHTNIKPLFATQKTPLLKAINLVSSHDVVAPFELPRQSISLKDGYGIALKDTITCYPLEFVVKLSTGEPIPLGINVVIAEEDIVELNATSITIPLHSTKGLNIKHKGEDIEQGALLIKKGERINAQKITSLAAQGIGTIETFKKPKVSILSIGNDVCSLRSKNITFANYTSNALGLGARIIELGGEIKSIKVCKENAVVIQKKLKKMSLDADFIITTGAMSSHDVMSILLQDTILSPLFHHVKISPSRPSALSYFNAKPILHLPGLPLSCLLGFEILGVPIVQILQNLPPLKPQPQIINHKEFACKNCCSSAIPGYCDGKTFFAAPFYEAGRLNVLSECNGYILTDSKEKIIKGELVNFFYFHPPVS